MKKNNSEFCGRSALTHMLIFVVTTLSLSCSTGFLKYKGEKDIFKNSDFEKKVQIKTDEVKPEPAPTPTAKEPKPVATAPVLKEKALKTPPLPVMVKSVKGKAAAAKTPPVVTVSVRQPELEDNEGFDTGSRRPKVDPFSENETVVHSVNYFAAEAGKLTFKVKPFVEVNGRKSYNFLTDLKTSRLFSSFYSVDDQVETYVDFEDLTPHVFKLHIKESGQLREGQSYFDHKTLKANYWETKYTEKKGHEKKQQEWEILPFSQNAFSGIFYMRIFKWEVGKEYSFRVADDEKNIVFKGTALKKEKISTPAGEFDAIQIKAQVVSRGALEQAGDVYFWLSDDTHKYVLRIEAKIKIGTLVSEVIEIKPGKKK